MTITFNETVYRPYFIYIYFQMAIPLTGSASFGMYFLLFILHCNIPGITFFLFWDILSITFFLVVKSLSQFLISSNPFIPFFISHSSAGKNSVKTTIFFSSGGVVNREGISLPFSLNQSLSHSKKTTQGDVSEFKNI
mgnify:CR=1 FL=1